MKFIFAVLVILVSCFCYKSQGVPQSWSQVLQRSASDSAVHNPSRNNHNNYVNRGRSRSSSRLGDCENDYNFHYILMSLPWAPGFCRTSPKGCVKMERRHFTIHGMWPSLDSSEGPEFCCFENTFNMNDLRPIMRDLNEYWPSLISQDNNRFWSHEWLKHGTCAKNSLNLKGEFNYFNTTLTIAKSMPILDTLKAAGIVPSENKVYQSRDIQNVLRQIHRASRVQVDCDLEHDQRVPVLTGINFCFDANLNPTDCRPTKSRCSREIRFVG